MESFTASKTDRHLLRQKVCQKISVIEKRFQRIGFKFMFRLEDNKNTIICFH